jgi:hypothetical protein
MLASTLSQIRRRSCLLSPPALETVLPKATTWSFPDTHRGKTSMPPPTLAQRRTGVESRGCRSQASLPFARDCIDSPCLRRHLHPYGMRLNVVQRPLPGLDR